MPTVSVNLDSELYSWLAERARDHDRTVAAELEAQLTALRAAPDEQTPLPLGVYAETELLEVDREGSTGEDPDLPVGVFDDSNDDDR